MKSLTSIIKDFEYKSGMILLSCGTIGSALLGLVFPPFLFLTCWFMYRMFDVYATYHANKETGNKFVEW